MFSNSVSRYLSMLQESLRKQGLKHEMRGWIICARTAGLQESLRKQGLKPWRYIHRFFSTRELQESLRKQGLKLSLYVELLFSRFVSCKRVYENKD